MVSFLYWSECSCWVHDCDSNPTSIWELRAQALGCSLSLSEFALNLMQLHFSECAHTQARERQQGLNYKGALSREEQCVWNKCFGRKGKQIRAKISFSRNLVYRECVHRHADIHILFFKPAKVPFPLLCHLLLPEHLFPPPPSPPLPISPLLTGIKWIVLYDLSTCYIHVVIVNYFLFFLTFLLSSDFKINIDWI